MELKFLITVLIVIFNIIPFPYGVAYGAENNYVLPVAGGNFKITQYPGGSFSHCNKLLSSNCENGPYSSITTESYDLAGRGVPVAVGDGVVIFAGWDNLYDAEEGYGLYVKIQHSDGLVSLYAHLRSTNASAGQTVKQGQPIGVIDSTGFSTADHLHFSFFRNGIAYSSAGLIDFSNLKQGNSFVRAFQEIFNINQGKGGPAEKLVEKPVEKIDLGPFQKMVRDFYKWALGVAGIVAFGVLIYAGILYIVSSGNSSKQNDAKEWIKAAISGLILLLAAYMILYTINPCIVSMSNGCL